MNTENLQETRVINAANLFGRITQMNEPQMSFEIPGECGSFWVGCADSRFSPADFPAASSGKFCLQQNIGNMVHPVDINCLFSMQYAIENENARNIYICGHYDCRIIEMIVENREILGDLQDWLMPLRMLADRYENTLASLSPSEKVRFLTRVNVIEQTFRAGTSAVVQEAWRRGRQLTVRGVIHNSETGLFEESGFAAADSKSLITAYKQVAGKLKEAEEMEKIKKSCQYL